LYWLDPRSALSILRILQEAISNVLQHARARGLRLAIVAEHQGGEPGVAVLLDDDGDGFVKPSGHGAARGGKGLTIMLNRAELPGAHLDWQPCGGGTRMRLWLPLRRQAVGSPG
jgi:signal transduction histidine kinase